MTNQGIEALIGGALNNFVIKQLFELSGNTTGKADDPDNFFAYFTEKDLATVYAQHGVTFSFPYKIKPVLALVGTGVNRSVYLLRNVHNIIIVDEQTERTRLKGIIQNTKLTKEERTLFSE
ncbi:MAG: hypothetical protein WCT18_01100 [Patescibacteria group bacterium]